MQVLLIDDNKELRGFLVLALEEGERTMRGERHSRRTQAARRKKV